MKYLLLLTFFSGCTYMNYGITPEKGCDINSYRKSDGTLQYYFTGPNCTETERRFRESYGSSN